MGLSTDTGITVSKVNAPSTIGNEALGLSTSRILAGPAGPSRFGFDTQRGSATPFTTGTFNTGLVAPSRAGQSFGSGAPTIASGGLGRSFLPQTSIRATGQEVGGTTAVSTLVNADRTLNNNPFGPTPEQVDSALGKTPKTASKTPGGLSTGGGSGGGGQREIPCPFCNGKVLPKRQGRLFQRLPGWLQRSFPIKFISTIYDYLIKFVPAEKYAVLNNDCKTCRNKRTIPDPTDDSAKWAAATANFQAAAPEIEREEAKLAAPGGNRYTIIQGSDILEVGLGMNDVPSYRVDKECMVRNNRMADLGNKEINPKVAGPVPLGGRFDHVQGINPPASPGGHYVIKCSNKFSIITGAQGVDITTGGPVTINGGITQITGPEVTVGTQTSRLALEGAVVNIGAKSIEMAPTEGQVFVKGTLATTGNMMCGGHAHMESASVVKLETTGKNQESSISAPNNIYGGPAFWGGPIYEGLQAALKELKSFVLFNTTNPEHAKYLVSLRYILGLGDNLQNIAYIQRPIELVPTGICHVASGSSAGLHFIYNFPHIHAMPDQMHTHETRVPDIKCDADDAPSLRGAYAGTAGPAPLHVETKKLTDALKGFWEVINLAFVGLASIFQHFPYRK